VRPEPRWGQSARAAPASASATDARDSAAGPAATASSGLGDSLERLGDYRIFRMIGDGGMGVVYQAVRESLHSHVALKVMHPRFRNRANFLKRFLNEARAAAHLHHTNIVSVFDYGTHDGVCYYATQYIAGQSLEDVPEYVRRLRADPGQEQVGLTRGKLR
jgi:serine/threonine protein kinase